MFAAIAVNRRNEHRVLKLVNFSKLALGPLLDSVLMTDVICLEVL